MSDKLFIFIDESGDPGFDLSVGASSTYYAELALVLTEDGLKNLIAHLINWRYVLGKYYEYDRLPHTRQLGRYISPLIEMNSRGELLCSCVYLMKDSYIGPYLKPTSYGGNNPILFRNFIHRKLLEYHFDNYPVVNGQDIELVFDFYTMSVDDMRNLEDYLRNNWNLPNLYSICHVNSMYAEPIQVASQLVNGVKDIILGTTNPDKLELLRFTNLERIDNP